MFALELHEKDIQMFSKLRLLQSVPFLGKCQEWKFRLNPRGEMVLVRSCIGYQLPLGCWEELWKEDKWEEQDLGTPPFEFGKAIGSNLR